MEPQGSATSAHSSRHSRSHGQRTADAVYPTVEEQAAALGYSIVRNHPFVDGNKRVGHAAMAVFLALNGRELVSDIDEAERVMLGLAAGTRTREQLVTWVRRSLRAAG